MTDKVNPQSGADSKSFFDEFQLEEYKNISNAHFESNKQISTFFRYYLLIASAPAVLFVGFNDWGHTLDTLLLKNGEHINEKLFLGFFLIIISLIGMFSCFYLISFRMDSILYARTVNGIRKYFYEISNIPNENQIRVLPKQINQPDYKQRHNFGVILYCFALIDSIYFAFGTRIIATEGDIFFTNYFHFPIIIQHYNITTAILLALSPMFLLHLFYHKYIIHHRLYSYMKDLTIGIDIDGVLNMHEKTFCSFLEKNASIRLKPEEITKIPVHLIPNISSSHRLERRHEYLVFNDLEYWRKQELFDNKVVSIIKELKNISGYKIHIFSWRPWPDTAFLIDNKSSTLKRWWIYRLVRIRIDLIPFFKYLFSKRLLSKARITLNINHTFDLPLFKVFQATKWYSNNLRFATIKRETKLWLRKKGVPYDDLTIERNSIDVRSSKLGLLKAPRNLYRNRYYYAQKRCFRYFIEDDPLNAIKLSSSCEYVFLINHNYNIDDKIVLPNNVIRVNDWAEIKSRIRIYG